MYFCLNGVEIACMITIGIGLAVGPFMMAQHYYKEKRETDLKQIRTESSFSAYERELMTKGFLFTSLWTIKDVQDIAREHCGMILDQAEAVAVAAIVKARFDPRRGVCRFTIIQAVAEMTRIRMARNNSKKAS